MSINSINSQGMIVQPTSLSTDTSTNELGQDDFLNILTTQLKYQDPLEPMEDTEFISQLAEFSALEQMEAMNQRINYSNAFDIMGNVVEVSCTDEITGALGIEEGIVESVSIQSGQVFLTVNGKEVRMESVVSVRRPDVELE